MTTQSNQSDAITPAYGPGSLQALGIGVLSFQQLASVVNWSNKSDFKSAEWTPWVDLPHQSSIAAAATQPVVQPEVQPLVETAVTVAAPDQPEASSPAVVTTPYVEPQAENAAPVTEPIAVEEVSAPAVTEEPALKELAAEQAASAKLAADATAATALAAAAELAAGRKRLENEAQLAAQKQAETQLAEKQLAEKQLAAEKLAEEQLAAEKLAFEQVAAEKLAAEKIAAEKLAAEKLAAETKELLIEQQTQTVQAASKAPASITNKQTAAPPTATSNAAPVRIITPDVSRAIRTTPQMALSAVPAANKPLVTQDAPLDDYVARLERLVLELNMEIGRRSDTSNSGDSLQELSRRVIELNLENLALREQLQYTPDAS